MKTWAGERSRPARGHGLRKDETMTAKQTADQRQAVDDVRVMMRPFSRRQHDEFDAKLHAWLGSFVWACQLPGMPVVLLDNSVIQDFKHAGTPADKGGLRLARATALVAFSRFLCSWNRRNHAVALSPVAVYEHLGRRPLTDVSDAEQRLQELHALMRPAFQSLVLFNAAGMDEFVEATRAVDHDAQLLFEAARRIGEGMWARELKAPIGVYIPLAIAETETPRDLPLRYFSPGVVHRVFAARTEQEVISQSASVSSVPPITSGEVSRRLAALNGLGRDLRKGKIRGLGDLEILQHCTIRQQHAHKSSHVFVGVCSDSGLQSLLDDFSNVVVGKTVTAGVSSDIEMREAVELMLGLSKPFAEEDKRLDTAMPDALSFTLAIAHLKSELLR